MATAGKKLTECPSNLKEAIDWILRVTGKDGQDGSSQNGTQQLAGAVAGLLDGVQSSSPQLESKLSEIKKDLTTDGNNGIINALADGLKKFKEGIQTSGSSSNVYQALNNSSLTSKVPKAGEIFLGCVPLCFYGLSYLYWRCSEKGGGWYGLTFTDPTAPALKNFMVSMGFDTKQLKGERQGGTGQKVAEALQSFQELKSAVENEKSLTKFFSTIHSNFNEKLKEVSPPIVDTLKQHSLPAIFLCSSAYFKYKRTYGSTDSIPPPSTIRQMLYWLSGLLVSPNFSDLLKHIHSPFSDGPMPVAVSGSHEQQEKLSADDLAGHLITSCISSIQVLRSIQGRAVSDEPLLHNVYCNSEFSYSDYGSALFNALSDYTYALQFQLSFLYQQCSIGITNGGWYNCKFGNGVVANAKSHICPVKCTKGSGCRHGSNGCNHASECGQSGKLSPLQAFLTDNLRGFSLRPKSYIGSPSHLENHPPGAICHVNMGFNADHLRSSGKGVYIFTTLNDFCSYSNTPLRQLSERLQCLTKRTPTTLGDIFGFYLQLIDQLFRTRMTQETLAGSILVRLDLSDEFHSFAISQYPNLKHIHQNLVQQQSRSNSIIIPEPSGLSRSLKTLYTNLPFWFQLFMVDESRDMAGALFDLRQHCHNRATNGDNTKHYSPDGQKECSHKSNHAADLWSLYYPQCTGKPCGKYLSPLCHTIGSTYAPKFAVTYLSWVLYLGDDLHSGFQEMLDEFHSVECTTDLGCETLCSHSGAQHGSAVCSCPSVVQCGGVLPLLYRHGFQFMDAKTLNGGQSGQNRKTCQNFHSQLSNVLAENAPLHNLLLAIDEFLYYVRFRFMSMVSSFWLCSLAILLYFIFYGIDVLHLESHAHFPSSHRVPPIGLLTTGKAPALTQLTYYMP